MGDVNMDGVIDINDAILITDYDAGLEILTEKQLSLADVNGDDIVDAGDAVKINFYIAGLITELA